MPEGQVVALVPLDQTPRMVLQSVYSVGHRGPSRKYATEAEKKAAKSKRQREARLKKNAPLYAAGYMRQRGAKMSDEEKRTKHREYRKNYDRRNREVRKNLLNNFPHVAAELGLHPPKHK